MGREIWERTCYLGKRKTKTVEGPVVAVTREYRVQRKIWKSCLIKKRGKMKREITGKTAKEED
eukprot:7660989-Karenia_brevis.AAC.1